MAPASWSRVTITLHFICPVTGSPDMSSVGHTGRVVYQVGQMTCEHGGMTDGEDRMGEVAAPSGAQPVRRSIGPRWRHPVGRTGASQGAVVGENLKRIRDAHSLTQHEAARRCQAVGLRWARSRISDVESGARDTIDVGTLRLLAEAFGVEMADFFAGDGDVQLSARACQPRAGLRAALRGAAQSPDAFILQNEIQVDAQDTTTAVAALESFKRRDRSIPIEADEALAGRLGVRVGDVLRAAEALWGRSLTEERDRRTATLGDLDAAGRAAHRGHITRELAQQVEQRLDGETLAGAIRTATRRASVLGLAGEPGTVTEHDVRQWIMAVGEAEETAGRQLGEAPAVVLVLAESLWGHSLGSERGRQLNEKFGVGPRSGSQEERLEASGAITEQLTSQIAAEIARREPTQ